jgi:uncharacterized RDD family membrane protein YckC
MRWRDTKKGVHKEVHAKKPLFAVAPFPRRLKAFVVDSFMLLMPILYVVFYLIFGSREGFAAHMLAGWLLILVPYGLITVLFFYKSAQTPGYKAYDIELKDLRTLQKPSLSVLIVRYVLMLFVASTLLGLFIPLFRKDKLALYDLLTHSAPLCK